VDLGLSPGAAISTVPAFILPWFDRPTLVDVGPSHLIWLLPLALVILVQTSGEDVFFKGYLQGWRRSPFFLEPHTAQLAPVGPSYSPSRLRSRFE